MVFDQSLVFVGVEAGFCLLERLETCDKIDFFRCLSQPSTSFSTFASLSIQELPSNHLFLVEHISIYCAVRDIFQPAIESSLLFPHRGTLAHGASHHAHGRIHHETELTSYRHAVLCPTFPGSGSYETFTP